jgi:TPR repeat protein
MIKILRTAAFLLCTAVSAPAMAQGLAEGGEAYQAGDYETALQEWRPLAEHGDVQAQHMIGIMYFSGKGVIQDYAEAVDWYRKAAEQGLAIAQNNLGFMYWNGEGVIQDYTEAENWLRKAAKQGYTDAQFSLGLMYLSGEGVIQDNVIAHMWLNISGANGSERGLDTRGIIEQLMTREQIAEAQAHARRCMSSEYQDCD